DLYRGEARDPAAHLLVRRLRAGAGEDDRRSLGRRRRRRSARPTEPEPEREAGAARHELETAAGDADRPEVVVVDRIDDDVSLELFEPRDDRLCTEPYDFEWNERYRPRRLLREDTQKIRIGHRRERMTRHRRLGQELVADEQMASIDRASVRRIRRADDGDGPTELVEQHVGHRADVARRRRVEGRAVLEERSE